MNASLELAQMEELQICAAIIEEGREFQKEQGFVQWTTAFPNRDTIREDISAGKGYVLKVDGEIAGYLFIDFGGDSDYDRIQGEWETQTPFAAVHRVAFSKEYRGMGLADVAFGLVGELCRKNCMKSIRMDTGISNQRMQHVLKKNGFVNCGTVFFQEGDRLAFEKEL